MLSFILDRKKLPVVSHGQQVKFKMPIVLVLKCVDTVVSYCDKIVGIKTKIRFIFDEFKILIQYITVNKGLI